MMMMVVYTVCTHTHTTAAARRLMRVILPRFYPPPFPDEKRFDLLAFSDVSHLKPLS